MKTSIKNTDGFSLLETIIALAIFASMAVMVGSTVMLALRINQFNKETRVVNMELYGIMVNGIGAYIRKGTAIMYADDSRASATSLIGTETHATSGINDFNQSCSDDPEVEQLPYDRLTVYQDRARKKYITFRVETNEIEETSRIVWQKENSTDWHYLNSEDTYITCFLVAASPNPYAAGADTNMRDIQPFVQLQLAGKNRHANNDTSNSFFTQATQISYRTLYTLRNYTLSM